MADATRARRDGVGVGVATEHPLSGAADAEIGAIVPTARAPSSRQLVSDGNSIVALRVVEGHIEVELSTPSPFRAQGDQLVLDLGDVHTTRSRHPDGDLTRIVFSLSMAAFNAAQHGDPVRVHYAASDTQQWDFGALDKSQLSP